MIVDVAKYLILGTKEELDRFFNKAQEQGFLEFISLSPRKQVETPVTVQNLLAAIKILRRQPLKEPYQGGGDTLLAMQVSERIIELKEDIEKLSEEKRVLEGEIARVAPFGYFSMEDIAYIEKEGKRKVHFFCMKTAKSHKTSLPPEVIYVSTEYDLDYYITISKEPIVIPGMIEMRIDATLGELENRLDFVQDGIERFEAELKDYAGHIYFLKATLIDEVNKHYLALAKKEVAYPLQNSLFAIEAWVPKNKINELFGFLDGMKVHVEQIGIDPEERVPTYLENEGAGLIGEDIIKIYDVPSTTDKDPSSWVLWFFALFFAVIVGDAGYGLIFLIFAIFLARKFPRVRGQQKRMLRLLFLLSATCIVWGIATSSYFGLKLAPSGFLSQISPLHYLVEKKADYHLANRDDVYQAWVEKCPVIQSAQTGEQMLEMATGNKKGNITYPIVEEFSQNIILEITLVIGIIHISCGFLRYFRRNIAGLGWISFMVGGYLFFPSFLHSTIIPEFMGWISKTTASGFGVQMLLGGIGFALVAALIQRKWWGLNEITNLVQVFADVLSYLRLYALSLAGAIMASTFNQEGTALGLALGLVIVFAGHLINILLSFMGGVIHGLRLNFLEWYHHSFEGGGRLFKPLKKLK